jgi:hypothetical protein
MLARTFIFTVAGALLATKAPAGYVRTADGKFHDGDVRFTPSGIVTVTLPNGATSRFDLSQLAEALFDRGAPPVPTLPALPRSSASGTNEPAVFVPSVPPPWVTGDIGLGSATGNSSYVGGSFILNGAGRDIGGESDNFHYVYQQLAGDGQIIARVTSLQNTATDAKAGLMIRDNLTPSARFIMAALHPAKSGAVIWRDKEGQPSQSLASTATVGAWIKIIRSGSTCAIYHSPDADTWTLADTRDIALGRTCYVGLAVASRSQTALCRATMDSVIVAPGVTLPGTYPKGVMLRGGSVLNGKIRQMDDSAVKFSVGASNFSVSTIHISRIHFRPMSPEMTNRIPRSRTGVLLANGDFFDGEFRRLDGNDIEMSSVMFGLRRFQMEREAVALVLRPPELEPTQFSVRSQDGSLFFVNTVRWEPGGLALEEPIFGRIVLPPGEITEFRRLKNPPPRS